MPALIIQKVVGTIPFIELLQVSDDLDELALAATNFIKTIHLPETPMTSHGTIVNEKSIGKLLKMGDVIMVDAFDGHYIIQIRHIDTPQLTIPSITITTAIMDILIPYLDLEDLINISQTNKEYHQLTNKSSTWALFLKKYFDFKYNHVLNEIYKVSAFELFRCMYKYTTYQCRERALKPVLSPYYTDASDASNSDYSDVFDEFSYDNDADFQNFRSFIDRVLTTKPWDNTHFTTRYDLVKKCMTCYKGRLHVTDRDRANLKCLTETIWRMEVYAPTFRKIAKTWEISWTTWDHTGMYFGLVSNVNVSVYFNSENIEISTRSKTYFIDKPDQLWEIFGEL